MTFKTAVWQDPETERFYARIFPDADGIDLSAWGLTALKPIDVESSALRGPQGLGFKLEEALHRISPDFPMGKFKPIWLGQRATGFDVHAALLAAVAA